MITQDTQSDNSKRIRNIQETKQSKDSSVSFTIARIDNSDIEIKKSGNINQTISGSSGVK
ncbi:13863_t:CDS:2 [Acaulospora colombiana]|uniref:13863_t:CDS:1 n=1 Tax=Acaulospora colombiana TaxID=27376 RepID=A0ACA9JXC0_9GLOM|nr:13863_t:CDS:2 [Acaulospora colombiana]